MSDLKKMMDEKEEKPTTPWKPFNNNHIVLKDPNYTPKWVHISKLTKALNEGCSLVKAEELKDPFSINIHGGTVVDGKIRNGANLILCKMHKDVALERKKFYQKQTEALLPNSVRELKKSLGDTDYGDIKQN